MSHMKHPQYSRRFPLASIVAIAALFTLCGHVEMLRAQVADPRDFFPLQIGNTWEFADGETGKYVSTLLLVGDTVNALGDTLIAYEARYGSSTTPSIGWYRADLLFHLFSTVDLDSSFQNLRYRLDAKVGDKWHVKTTDTISWAEVIDMFPMSVFGVPTTAMKIEYYLKGDGFEQWSSVHTIAAGFGPILIESHPSSSIYLTGAIINDKRYGKLRLDVPSVSVSSLTLDCAPNPCAGAAIISYSLPTSGPLRLTLSDMLGREVAVLADGDREAGEYRVRFDGAVLPNGTYFLHLSRNGTRTSRSIQLIR